MGPTPSYLDINNIISKVVSSCTASLRFEGELNVDLNELQCHQIFPRLHFMTPSMSPIINKHAFMKNKRLLVDGYVRDSFNDKITKNEIQRRYFDGGLLYK